MRHQIPRPEISLPGGTSSSSLSNTAGASSGGGSANPNPNANLPGTSSEAIAGSSSAVANNPSLSNPSSSSSPSITGSSMSTPRGVGPPGSKPHSVIRTLRQMSMMADSLQSRRSSFASPTSAAATALLTNLEGVYSAEVKSAQNPACIVRHVVAAMGNIIKEMRADAEVTGVGGPMVEDLSNCSDVATLRQRLISVERANHMMTIHLDLMELQKKLEMAEAQKLDDRKTFVIATREELYKEIVELLEAEFSCSICNEVFVSPSVTKCGHTFCELCIATWTKDKVDCPICRTMIFTEWGKHVEMDNFITRLHLRLSDEIRDSREALVAERGQAIETLRNTPRRNEGAAFVDALRFLRDQQQQGRTTPTTARALAERFRAMRRTAVEANIDEVVPSSAAAALEGPTARMRARLMEELETLRHHQQQNTESLNRLSRATGSGGQPPPPTSSVARIRVRPSPGVSFTLVAPRSMLSAQQSSAPVSAPNQIQNVTIRAPESRNSPASPPAAAADGQLTGTGYYASGSPVEIPRRVPHGLLLARAYSLRLQNLQSQQTAQSTRSCLERAMERSRSASRVPESPSSPVAVTPASSAVNNSRNEDAYIADPSAANAVRTIRSIFSSLDAPQPPQASQNIASSAETGAGASSNSATDSGVPSRPTDSNSSSSDFPLMSSSFRLSAANQGNANFPFQHGTSPRSMSSRLSGLIGSETSTTLSSGGRPITSTMHLSEAIQPISDNSQESPLPSSIRSASSEILRAFSENEAPISSTSSVPAADTTDSDGMTLTRVAVDPVPESELDTLDRRLRLGQVSLHDAIIAFRQRFERAMGGDSNATNPLPQQHIVPDVDVDMNEPLSAIFPPGGDTLTIDTDAIDLDGVNNNGISTLEAGSLGITTHSPLLRQRSGRSLTTNEDRLDRPRLVHHLRESRRRRRERNHREGGDSRERRGRETTITISFSRGDEERSNSGGGADSQPSGSRSTSSPAPPALASRPSTSSVSGMEIPSNMPLPIVMDCDSDTPSPGPSSELSRANDDRNENTDSPTVASPTSITGTSATARPAFNGTLLSSSDLNANADDIEILFSDLEDA